VTNCGKPFRARGPATAKVRSPGDERRVADTTRADDEYGGTVTDWLSLPLPHRYDKDKVEVTLVLSVWMTLA